MITCPSCEGSGENADGTVCETCGGAGEIMGDPPEDNGGDDETF